MKSTKTEPGLTRGLRRYLYATAMVTGGAIMVIEVVGAKMLSPYIGTSHFVWTAQIAVTLVALAVGYYAGGRLADRSPNLTGFYCALVGAAAWIAFSVLITEPVAYWCLGFNLAFGSLLTSAVLFFLPLALLAMTGPFLVRVITSSLSGVGGNVGRLTSLNTLGSVAGTMLVAYVVTPRLPNSLTMYFTALALALICGGFFVFFRRKSVVPLLGMWLLVALPGLGLLPGDRAQYRWFEEKYRANSHFGLLQVLEAKDGSSRYYLNDNLVQNTYDPRTKQSASTFTYMLSGLARAYTAEIKGVLCIGLGVGIVPMEFAREGKRVDVVEINPAVVPMAVRWFNLEPSRFRLVVGDGRYFLRRCEAQQYDAVILDAFLGDSSPSHLMTREAFASIRRVLRPGGALVINTFSELEHGKDYFPASLEKTLRSVFPGVRLHSTGDGAVFFVATDRPEPEFLNAPTFDQVHNLVRREVEATFAGRVATDPVSGRILTDDYNPVEFFDASNREATRQRLAAAVRSM